MKNIGKKKGFTLIELLAVIIILGVLMLIAIPSVTEYIGNSRKKTYLATADQYINGAIAKVNGLELPISDTDTTYYIPASSIALEKGGKSPYGEWTDAYVVVTTNGTTYDYYWTSLDTSGNAVRLAYGNKLTNESIEAGVDSLDLSVGVGGRSKIVIFNSDGSITSAVAASTIADGGSLVEGTSALATSTSCFNYEIFDEAGFVAWYGASDITQAEQWLMQDYGVDISKILNGVAIYGYKEYQSDGTTPCPAAVSIPSKIDGRNVVWIEYEAFAPGSGGSTSNHSNIGRIERLSSTANEISNSSGNPLTSVVIPSGVVIIDNEAFNGNTISSLSLPNTVEYIGSTAFIDNDIVNLTLPNSIKYIGYLAFSGNQISSLVIPSSLETLGHDAFAYNSIASLTIQNGIEIISNSAFEHNSLTTLTIPSSVTEIGNGAFTANLLTSVTFSSGLQKIGAFGFTGNSLTTVALPATFNYLCDYAFDQGVTITPSTPTWGTACCNCAT